MQLILTRTIIHDRTKILSLITEALGNRGPGQDCLYVNELYLGKLYLHVVLAYFA